MTIEPTPAQRDGLNRLATLAGQIIASALEPALRGGFVPACGHLTTDAAVFGATERTPVLCPMHPRELLCNFAGCVSGHWSSQPEHRAEHIRGVPCFACERRCDSATAPLWASVHLDRPVPVSEALSLTGDLATLPVAWLCAEHAGLVAPPLVGVWPQPDLDAELGRLTADP